MVYDDDDDDDDDDEDGEDDDDGDEAPIAHRAHRAQSSGASTLDSATSRSLLRESWGGNAGNETCLRRPTTGHVDDDCWV